MDFLANAVYKVKQNDHMDQALDLMTRGARKQNPTGHDQKADVHP